MTIPRLKKKHRALAVLPQALMLHVCLTCCTTTPPPEGPPADERFGANYFSKVELTRVGHQRTLARPLTDTPFRLKSDGPTVGRVRAGTELSVFTNDDFPGWLLADLPLPAARGDRLVLKEGTPTLGVFLPIEASTADTHLLRQGTKQSTRTMLHGLYRELSTEPGGPPFAFVRCQPVEVLRRQGDHVYVAAKESMVELFGWLERPTHRKLDAACQQTSAMPENGRCGVAPHGYQDASDWSKELTALVRKGTLIFWADAWAPVRTCRAWRFGGESESSGYLELRDLPNDLTELRVSVLIHPGAVALTLSNAALTYTNGQEVIVGGGSSYTPVGFDVDRIDFVRWSGSTLNRGNEVCSYHAASTYRWYMSREACEKGGNRDIEY